MTTLEILNERVNQILGSRYQATNNNAEFAFRMSGYKLAPSMVLNLIEEKAGNEAKKEIAKYCLMIKFGK